MDMFVYFFVFSRLQSFNNYQYSLRKVYISLQSVFSSHPWCYSDFTTVATAVDSSSFMLTYFLGVKQLNNTGLLVGVETLNFSPTFLLVLCIFCNLSSGFFAASDEGRVIKGQGFRSVVARAVLQMIWLLLPDDFHTCWLTLVGVSYTFCSFNSSLLEQREVLLENLMGSVF